MSSIKRQAIKDADEFAMAKMFYGEGAGVRRRLINQTVMFKRANVPGYAEAFEKELAHQDFAKLSRKARRDRRFLDAKGAIDKNGKALVRGDYRNLSLPLLVIGSAAFVAHQTGADKKAWDFSKQEYRRAKGKVTKWNAERKAKKNPPEDTNVHDFGATGPR